MAIRTATQLARRRQVEQMIRLMAPFLDAVLAVGDRVSRIAGRDHFEPEPPRHPRAALGGPQPTT